MTESNHAQQHSIGQFLAVWVALLASTAIEVWLAYRNLAPVRMVVLLLGLSIIKAVLIMAWFMHLKFEQRGMRWAVWGVLAAWLSMLTLLLPDAFRIVELGVR